MHWNRHSRLSTTRLSSKFKFLRKVLFTINISINQLITICYWSWHRTKKLQATGLQSRRTDGVIVWSLDLQYSFNEYIGRDPLSQLQHIWMEEMLLKLAEIQAWKIVAIYLQNAAPWERYKTWNKCPYAYSNIWYRFFSTVRKFTQDHVTELEWRWRNVREELSQSLCSDCCK